jgi:hypothetical protein
MMNKLVPVVGVEVVGDHCLRLTFKDGLVGDVDFTEREWRGMSEPLADPAFFARVCVDREARTVVWPNGYDMAPEPLYEQVARRSATATDSAFSAR